MAWAPTKDKGAIGKFGGGVIRVREVSDDGQTISTTDTAFHDIGHIQSHDFADDTPLESVYDETGQEVASDEGNRTIKITGILMQTNKEALDIAKDTRGKYYRAYVYNGILDGKHQEVFLGICRIKPMFSLSSPGKRTPFEITCLKNEAQIVISTTELGTLSISSDTYPKCGTGSTQTIPAAECYLIVETAVS